MALLLIQIAVILLVTTACGSLALRVGQARVIGQIVGGIVLGPSFLGRLLPHAFARLFPAASLAPFEALSTIGLILFLFIVGAEVDSRDFYRRRVTTLFISFMSILFPFAIAAVLASRLVRFAPRGVGNHSFVVFLGISMSITAFPVLARIVEERNLQGTSLGTMAICCAALDDIAAWLLLAIALALREDSGGFASLFLRLGGLLFYLIVMLGVVRPLASRFVRNLDSSAMSSEIFGLTLVGVIGSAAATEVIGVHHLFGAFLAGVCLPRNQQLRGSFRASLHSIISVFLLPLFFALTGMRTRLDLLNSATLWIWSGVVLIAATAGKMGGAALAARWTGHSWKDAFALGALLNTRGLVELVVLKIAYDVGVFSATLFTMLVIMALITTACTTPILKMLHIERDDPNVHQSATR